MLGRAARRSCAAGPIHKGTPSPSLPRSLPPPSPSVCGGARRLFADEDGVVVAWSRDISASVGPTFLGFSRLCYSLGKLRDLFAMIPCQEEAPLRCLVSGWASFEVYDVAPFVG